MQYSHHYSLNFSLKVVCNNARKLRFIEAAQHHHGFTPLFLIPVSTLHVITQTGKRSKHRSTMDVFACCDWIRLREHTRQFSSTFVHLYNSVCVLLKFCPLSRSCLPTCSWFSSPQQASHNFTVTQLFISLLAGNHGELTSHPGTATRQRAALFSSLCSFIL